MPERNVVGDRGGGVTIEALTEPDLGDVAMVHVHAFGRSELARLGPEAVRRNYRWQLNGPHDLVALGARVDGELVGFLFGGVFRGSTIGFVKHDKWFLLGRVLRNPGMVIRRTSLGRLRLAARLLLSRSPADPAPERPDAVPARSFGVLAVAVGPASQGAGVGQALMAEAEVAAERLGFERMHLTVAPDNESSVRFYEKGGWDRVLDDAGHWRGQMVKPLG